MRRLAPLVLVVALLAVPAAAGARTSNAHMAALSYRALQHYYYVGKPRLYRGEPRYSYVWPFSQAMSATIALAGMPGQAHHYAPQVRNRLLGLRNYFNRGSDPPGYDSRARPPLDRGGAKNYDDNEWIGLELLRRYRQQRERFLLRRARTLFDLAVFGWDRDESHPCPGGVLFSQNPRYKDRNTVSNAPGAELGFRLYEITHHHYYRRWATKMYAWVRRCLSDTASDFYFDHINFAGRIDPTVWTYNQGTMIGSNVLLYRITHRKGYLKRARRIAVSAMSYFNGPRLAREPPPFVAIFFERMLLLDATRHDPAYRRYMQGWANRAWRHMRDPHTGVFAFDPSRSDKVNTQAAFTKLYANLAWPRSRFQ